MRRGNSTLPGGRWSWLNWYWSRGTAPFDGPELKRWLRQNSWNRKVRK